jgi:hypothetical protein
MTDQIATLPKPETKPLIQPNEATSFVSPFPVETHPQNLIARDRVPECTRLLVLIPLGNLQENRLTQRIWNLASAERIPVLLLGISGSYEEESRLRRRLANLAALIRDPRVKVETRILDASHWSNVLRSILRPGDTLLVQTEHEISKGWFRLVPVAEILPSITQVQVSVLSGYCSKVPRSNTALVRKLIAWPLLG